MQDFGTKDIATNSKKPFCTGIHRGFFFGSQVTNEVIMKHFKVKVQYQNGTEFVYECDAESNWQAAAIARVQGRRLGFGGAMDVVKTDVEEC